MKKCALAIFTAFVALIFSGTVSAGKELNFATDHFPPYYYIEENQPKGIQYELAALAFAKMYIPFEVKFLPWQRALKSAQYGNADGVFGLRKTSDRERWLIFPEEPLMTVRTVIFHRKKEPFQYTGIASLSGKKIGVTKGYTYGQNFDQSTIFKKEEVTSLRLNFLKLAAGRIDLVAAYKAVGLYTLKQMKLDNEISFCDLPIHSMPIYVGFKRKPGNGEKAAEFSQTLKQIKESPECRKLIMEFGIDQEIINPCR